MIRKFNKIFVIGMNKTGTTTLGATLKSFGVKMGHQTVGEMISVDYGKPEFERRLIAYCETAVGFQDLPFSKPGIYKILDKAFPNSKFILSVRNSAEEWYSSLIRFHTKLFSSDKNRLPTIDDLKNAMYLYKGFMYEIFQIFWKYPEIPLYDKDSYCKIYEEHNNDVRTYFKDRPNDFIEINVARPGDFQRLCHFLGIITTAINFPWLNKT